MDKYRQLSEDSLRNNLGYTLIQWVKRVHEKKTYKKNNGSVNEHSTHYNHLISREVIDAERLKREANYW